VQKPRKVKQRQRKRSQIINKNNSRNQLNWKTETNIEIKWNKKFFIENQQTEKVELTSNMQVFIRVLLVLQQAARQGLQS
jgi:hypothetical protein